MSWGNFWSINKKKGPRFQILSKMSKIPNQNSRLLSTNAIVTLQCLHFYPKRAYILQTNFTCSNDQSVNCSMAEWRIETPQFQGYIFSIFCVISWFRTVKLANSASPFKFHQVKVNILLVLFL